MAPESVSNQQISVLLVEDNEVMRFSLRAALQNFGNLINIVGEAANGAEAVRLVRELNPEVVLMDIGLPELNGIDATRAIKLELPQTRIIMLTSFDDAQRTCASLAAGADAYCIKSISTPNLVDVVERVRAGQAWLDPAVAAHVVKVYTIQTANDPRGEEGDLIVVSDEDDEELVDLTRRELAVLRLLMDDRKEDEIALRLGVHEGDVQELVRTILTKLSTDKRTQAYLAHLIPGLT